MQDFYYRVVVPTIEEIFYRALVLSIVLVLMCVALTAQQSCSDKLLPITKGSRFGYINAQGRIVVKPQFDYAWDFSDGMGRVEKKEKYGFVDKNGKVTFLPQFNMVSGFSDGLAAVKVPDGTCELCGGWKYIDRSFHLVIDMSSVSRSNYIGEFSEGLASFKSGGDYGGDISKITPYGFIDKGGKIAIPPKFGDVGAFHEGLASFTKDFMRTSGYGYIDSRGEVVIEPRFASVGDFSDGLAVVKIAGKEGFIDKTGKIVIEPKFDSAWPFSEGVALVTVGGKYGYISGSGKYVIEPQFEWSWSFSEGMAPAELNGKYGFIDKTGKFVIAPRFEKLDEKGFSCGLAQVLESYKVDYPYKLGYIDTNGNYVWKPTY